MRVFTIIVSDTFNNSVTNTATYAWTINTTAPDHRGSLWLRPGLQSHDHPRHRHRQLRQRDHLQGNAH